MILVSKLINEAMKGYQLTIDMGCKSMEQAYKSLAKAFASMNNKCNKSENGVCIVCDIYTTKCHHHKGCMRVFDVHIGDFVVDREKVKIFCEAHLPEKNIMVFRINRRCKTYGTKKSELIGVRVLNEKHKNNQDITLNDDVTYCGRR